MDDNNNNKSDPLIDCLSLDSFRLQMPLDCFCIGLIGLLAYKLHSLHPRCVYGHSICVLVVLMDNRLLAKTILLMASNRFFFVFYKIIRFVQRLVEKLSVSTSLPLPSRNSLLTVRIRSIPTDFQTFENFERIIFIKKNRRQRLAFLGILVFKPFSMSIHIFVFYLFLFYFIIFF